MGRKSNRKKGRLELRTAIKTDQRRQKQIFNLITYCGAALFIWGILLFDKTFINLQTQIFVTLCGATVATIVLHFLWRHKNQGPIATFFLGFFLGGSIPYCFLATTNYYFRDKKTQTLKLEIIETGNRSRRKSRCRTPYAIVEFQNARKEIPFDCDYETTISNYKSLKLTVSRGLWGFSVYKDKLLNN